MTDEEIWDIFHRANKLVRKSKDGSRYFNAANETVISIEPEFKDERNYKFRDKDDIYRVSGETFHTKLFDITNRKEAIEYAEQSLIERGFVILNSTKE